MTKQVVIRRRSLKYFCGLFLLSLAPSLGFPDSASKIETIGEQVSMKFLGQLKSELVAAMKEGGPENAISVCSKRAREIAKSVAEQHPAVVEVKRSSEKYRNPLNAPIKIEREVLAEFAQFAENNKSLPKFLTKGEGQIVHYFRPIMISGECLACHGLESSLREEVSAALSRLYPKDSATGYKAGDLRGVLRVSLRAGNIRP